MTRAQVVQWLLTLGKDWVGLIDIFREYADGYDPNHNDKFWDNLEAWHDGAYVTKRHADANLRKSEASIQQYRLTKKALTMLGERTTDE